MRLIYQGTNTKEIDISDIEDFYPTIAKIMVEEENGNRVLVTATTDDGHVKYRVGVRSGTQTIFEMENTMPRCYIGNVKPAYLVCIEPYVNEYLRYLCEHPEEFDLNTFADEISSRTKNSYKEYIMTPKGDEFTAAYGRMAVGEGQLFGKRMLNYPITSYWCKYYEKIGKGYVDKTDIMLTDEPQIPKASKATKKEEPFLTSASHILFNALKNFAKRAVREAKVNVPLNTAIISKTKDNIEAMRDAAEKKDLVKFNLLLLDTLSTLQRPVETGDGKGVQRLLAFSEDDLSRIIERETDLLNAMEGSISGHRTDETQNDFAKYDIEVYEATQKQRKQVLAHLDDSLKQKVKNVYRVIPNAQKKRFNEYLKKNNIEKVKLLWHGSRNENWMNIVMNSLLLNPNAVITGKMFGKGIYFAPSSNKSWGYTSYLGSKWASGNSSTAYMGLYAVAYGKPKDVDTWDPSMDYETLIKDSDCNCLHAHAGASLKMDEIVFYDEAAVLLDYIVEFGK